MLFLNRKLATSSQNNNNLIIVFGKLHSYLCHESNELHFLSVYQLIKTTREEAFSRA